MRSSEDVRKTVKRVGMQVSYLAAVCLAACQHSTSSVATQPLFSQEQLRARSGAWGGPEATLAAETLALSLSRAPWVVDFARETKTLPRLSVGPLVADKIAPESKARFDRELHQALVNQGKLELLAADTAPERQDARGRVTLCQEALVIEGEQATRYRLHFELTKPGSDAIVWQDEQVISKWTAATLDTEARPL